MFIMFGQALNSLNLGDKMRDDRERSGSRPSEIVQIPKKEKKFYLSRKFSPTRQQVSFPLLYSFDVLPPGKRDETDLSGRIP